jgi:predicted nucleic acid-binding protein
LNDVVAFLDACVLYSAPVRDLLIELAVSDHYRARWSERVLDEWIRAILRNRPDLSEARLGRTRALMNEHTREALVTDYEHHMARISLPDHDDRHILAASIECDASIILTLNLKDLPQSILSEFGIAAQHADQFIANLIEQNSLAVARSMNTVRKRLRKDPKTAAEYLDTLDKQGLPATAKRARPLLHLI